MRGKLEHLNPLDEARASSVAFLRRLADGLEAASGSQALLLSFGIHALWSRVGHRSSRTTTLSGSDYPALWTVQYRSSSMPSQFAYLHGIVAAAGVGLALFAVVVGAVGCKGSARVSRDTGAAGGYYALEVRDGTRLLVVAPHPDDETIGAGGLIQRVLERHGHVDVVLLTAGDGYVEAVRHETGELQPRPIDYFAYGERRLAEARAALRTLGRTRIRLELLGFPDGGLDRLLRAHWWRQDPERSSTTGRSSPPYTGVLERHVAYDGDDLRRELTRVVRDARPTAIALPDPLDRHPDHRATGLFVLIALADYGARHGQLPQLLGYLVHWPNWPPGWNDPAPSPLAWTSDLLLPPDLPDRGRRAVVLRLSDLEVRTKADALAKYRTQHRAMGSLLRAFIRRTEPFTELTAADVQGAAALVTQMIPPPPHR